MSAQIARNEIERERQIDREIVRESERKIHSDDYNYV